MTYHNSAQIEICGLKGQLKYLLQEHRGKLWVSERKGPKSQIRGGVWHCTQYEFNGLDQLMDKDVWKRVTLMPCATFSLQKIKDAVHDFIALADFSIMSVLV